MILAPIPVCNKTIHPFFVLQPDGGREGGDLSLVNLESFLPHTTTAGPGRPNDADQRRQRPSDLPDLPVVAGGSWPHSQRPDRNGTVRDMAQNFIYR